MQYKRVLTIAGSDPCGGAGIQADIKTISACGCYAMSAITAIVDQNSLGVYGIHPVPTNFIKGQIKSVLEDYGVDAIKIGMLHSEEQIIGVCEALVGYPASNIVIDPVMVATTGSPLLQENALKAIKNALLPIARIITPNIPEAEKLTGISIDSEKEMQEASQELSFSGKISVLLKGGHLSGNELVDILFNAETNETLEFRSPKIDTGNTHGTGCTLSSAIASFLAHGMNVTEAACKAKTYISEAILQGAPYSIARGHGPVHHFYNFWK
jgi:phosphomethylpyrimidine kinase